MPMKNLLIFSLCLLFSPSVLATENRGDKRLHIEVETGELIADSVCIYKGEMYSEGAEIKMETQGFYRCERYYQGKTIQKDKKQLRWVRISSDD